jgi:LacI family transcriptional regulator
MATIRDVAKKAGVSIATVSAAINGNKYVSPLLKQQVMEAVRQLGYTPDAIARSLKRGRTHLIGLIVADVTNPFFTELIHFVERAARKEGYSVLLCDTDQNFETEYAYLQLMRTYRAEGVILAPAGRFSDYRQPEIENYDLPMVFIDRLVPGLNFDGVALDNHKAAFQATSYMLDLGHRKLATIAGPDHLSPALDRIAGFRDALQQRGIPFRDPMVRNGNFEESQAFRACQELLAEPERPTALFVANNHMLIGVMRAITQQGLSCPKDISVTSVDDFPWANAFTPRLTTVRQPVEEFADNALRLLLRRLSIGQGQPASKVILEPTLILRDSCIPLNDGRMQIPR